MRKDVTPSQYAHRRLNILEVFEYQAILLRTKENNLVHSFVSSSQFLNILVLPRKHHLQRLFNAFIGGTFIYDPIFAGIDTVRCQNLNLELKTHAT